ncbi:MAG: hypothetical protein ACRDZR_17815 [Acidimicrobiales bacterium]
MADAAFVLPRLASVYDPLVSDRGDLDVYAAIVEELGANDVIDLGCGTGTFACFLARRGKKVICGGRWSDFDDADAGVEMAEIDRVARDHGLVVSAGVEDHAGVDGVVSVSLSAQDAGGLGGRFVKGRDSDVRQRKRPGQAGLA